MRALLLIILATAASLAANGLAAQPMSVFSTGSDARACSWEARMAEQGIGNVREGVTLCTRALEFDKLNLKDRAATLVNRGILLTADRRFSEALDDYNKALELVPELAESFVGRGNLVFMAGRHDLAVEEYNKALALNLSLRHVGLFNRGLAYEQQGLQAEARADFQQALILQPDWILPREKLQQLDNPPAP